MLRPRFLTSSQVSDWGDNAMTVPSRQALERFSIYPATDPPTGGRVWTTDSRLHVGTQITVSRGTRLLRFRYYFGTGMTQGAVGNLFNDAGTLLATANFSGETVGWNVSADIATPYVLQVGTTYMVAVYMAGTTYYENVAYVFPVTAGSVTASGGYYGASSSAKPASQNADQTFYADGVFDG